MVKDGMTIVLGGMRKDERKTTDQRVPKLSNLPFVGNALFKQKVRDNTLSELVVFITPHIVFGDVFVTGDEPEAKFHQFRDYGTGLFEPKGAAATPPKAGSP
jgi:type II secretory pathway component GspD/PulD (secretin)